METKDAIVVTNSKLEAIVLHEFIGDTDFNKVATNTPHTYTEKWVWVIRKHKNRQSVREADCLYLREAIYRFASETNEKDTLLEASMPNFNEYGAADISGTSGMNSLKATISVYTDDDGKLTLPVYYTADAYIKSITYDKYNL